jgi:hypothetical protein
VILLTIAALLLSQPLRSPVVSAQSDPFRAVYDNDELFNQLSGAARTLLELKFGKKGVKSALENQADTNSNIPAANKSAGPGGGAQPTAALANNIVNDPAADTTAQDTQSETTIVLGSGTNVISSFNDSGSFLGGASQFTGFSRSTNMGTSWIDGGTLPTNPNGDVGDPVLARNNTSGRTYLATLQFSGSGIDVFRSDDDALIWMAPTQGAPGKSGMQDKEWIAVDNFSGSGQGNVYLIERDFGAGNGIYFFRSTDNGSTFLPSGGTLIASGAANNVQGAFVAVGSDHSVYALYYDQSSPQAIRVKKSIDQGLTFGSAVTVTTLTSVGTNGDLSLGGFRSNSFPQAAVNPSNANIIYVVYNNPTAASGGDRGNIFFRQSTDGGANWGAAVQLNNDATTRAQFMPAIAVKPDGSGLAVTWYDRRRDPADALIERWGVTATISGGTLTFGPNFKVSNAQFPAVFGVDPVVNSTYMGDYDSMAADNSFFYSTWGDNRDQSIAVPSRKNANVRFAKIPMAGPGPIVEFAAATVSGGNGNGRIDPNECNNLTVKVMNDGSAMATVVSVTLSTSTAGVTILDSPQSYGDIAPGAMAQNATPFQVSTSASIPCPSTITFTVVASYAGGSDTSTFTLPVGGVDYAITPSSGASIVAGTTDVGNHGDDVTTNIALPFSYQFYGTTFTSANVSSNGNIQFVSNNNAFTNACLPTAAFNMAILAHWDDLRTDGVGGGIFTSISGSAPNRIFNIEWRTIYFGTTLVANFEARLYEGQSRLDLVYGQMDQGGSGATVGLQRDTGSAFTQFECNTAGSLTAGLQLIFTLPPCASGNGECGVACTITCPANITQSNDSGQCGARITYPTPTTSGSCGAVTCAPTAGSSFPVGTTTVTCTAAGGPSCSFTVTVQDTQAPTITCPSSITQTTTRGNKCIAVTYPSPTVTENCPGPTTVVCAPASGFCFPVGTTTVTCTATDSSSNTATCSFMVTVLKPHGH